jgi:hypothetical protein
MGQIPHGVLPGSIAEVWAGERPCLMVPQRPFDGFVEQTKLVSPVSRITARRRVR